MMKFYNISKINNILKIYTMLKIENQLIDNNVITKLFQNYQLDITININIYRECAMLTLRIP
jgi:hypothetical protein